MDRPDPWFLEVGVVVRAPARELDLASAPVLELRLREVVRPGRLVVLDLAGTTFIDCSVLGQLVATAAQLRVDGGRLVLVHVDERVQRVLHLTGLLSLPHQAEVV